MRGVTGVQRPNQCKTCKDKSHVPDSLYYLWKTTFLTALSGHETALRQAHNSVITPINLKCIKTILAKLIFMIKIKIIFFEISMFIYSIIHPDGSLPLEKNNNPRLCHNSVQTHTAQTMSNRRLWWISLPSLIFSLIFRDKEWNFSQILKRNQTALQAFVQWVHQLKLFLRTEDKIIPYLERLLYSCACVCARACVHSPGTNANDTPHETRHGTTSKALVYSWTVVAVV